MFSDSIIGIAVAIGVLFLQILVIAVFRPYKHNLRPVLNTLVIIGTLGIYLSYRNRIVN